MNHLRTALETLMPIPDEDWQKISRRFRREEFGKNSLMLANGTVEKYLYFIECGVLRAWLEKRDQDITFEFAFENTLYCSYTSFLTQTPSRYNVQAITNMIVWKIGVAELEDLYKEMTIGQQLARKAAEMMYIEKEKRELALLTRSPQERYLDLFVEQPHLVREIPLKYLASYIGVTPQALSRIRKRIS